MCFGWGFFGAGGSVPRPAGTAGMKKTGAPFRAGAPPSLNRQYTTIAMVGVVLFLVLGLSLGWPTAGGFAIGAVLSWLAGYIGIVLSGPPDGRPPQGAPHRNKAPPKLPFPRRALHPLLVVG